MCFGGDVGVFAHGDNVRELEIMIDYGMSTQAALVAATSGNASYFRQGERIGRVKPGMFADLIAVQGDPSANIKALRSVQFVMKNGKIYKERRREDCSHVSGDAMKKFVSLFVLLSGLSLFAATEHGPEKGTLVIVGGNMQDPAIVKRFIDLAGGPDAPIVIIPTAGDDDEYDNYWSGLKQWRENGAKHLTVLHTRDRKVADTEAFVKPIRDARGVFFGGGRQWRLADSYLNTLTHKELTGAAQSRRRHWRLVGRRVDPDVVHGARRHQEQRGDDRRSHRRPGLLEERRRRPARAAPQPAVRHAGSDRQAS